MSDPLVSDLEQPLLPPEAPPTDNLSGHNADAGSPDTPDPNWWQSLTFRWLAPTLSHGSSLPQLHQCHLPALPADVDPEACGDALWAAWQRELAAAAAARRPPSLLRALFPPFGMPYLALGVFKLCNDALNFAGPVLLNQLLRHLDAPRAGLQAATTGLWGHLPAVSLARIPSLDPSSPVFGAACAGLLALSLFLKAFLNAQLSYRQGLISARVRAALTSLCFRQTLALPAAALASVGAGRVQTLMSVDADRALGLFIGFHELWSLPLQIAVALALLYSQVRFAFLAGLALVLLIIPVNKVLANGIQRASVRAMAAKDRRIAVVGEVLRGVRAVKAAGWEGAFAARIGAARAAELSALALKKYLDAVCVVLWAVTSLLFSVGTFGLCVALGQPLTAQVVFTSLSLFSVLLGPLNSFPWVINGVVEATVSTRRLSSFLALQRERRDGKASAPAETSDGEPALEVRGSFSWSIEEENAAPTLHDIDLTVPAGALVAVTGDVAAGKSSLLAAALGEMHALPGARSRISGAVAYAAQDPWLMPGTIKDNIVLGSDAAVDSERYRRVLEACALHEDLESMPRGDATAVGDAGATLSGGQRARVALARALCRDADVYLLDDVLAAVDARVGAWITERALLGPLMAGKTVVIATHAPPLLTAAGTVVTMESGRVASVVHRKDSIGGRMWSRGVDAVRAGGGLLAGRMSPRAAHAPGRGLTEALDEDSDPKKQVLPASQGVSGASDDQDPVQDAEEGRTVGHVRFAVYRLYYSLQGPWAPLTLVSLALMQTTRNSSDLWLSFWVGRTAAAAAPAPAPAASLPAPATISPDVRFYLSVLLALAAANFAFTVVRAFAFARGGLVAARRLHARILAAVLALPPAFFDANPVGRILNRFSSDTATADDSLPFIANILLAQAAGLAGVSAVLLLTQPYLLLAVAPIALAYRALQRFYRSTSRELRRLESVARSPVYVSFAAALGGGPTIRAFGARGAFLTAAHGAVAAQQRAALAALGAASWLALRLQIVAGGIAAAVGGLAVAQHAGIVPGAAQAAAAGFVGLSLAYALPITGLLNGLLTASAETEQEMVAVERINEYIQAEPQPEVLHVSPLTPTGGSSSVGLEGGGGSGGLAALLDDSAPSTPHERSPLLAVAGHPTTPRATGPAGSGALRPAVPPGWPQRGAVAFSNVWLRYRPTSEFVLQGLNLELAAGTRAGLCGRTGAGKSSVVACLLRLAEICAGAVTIDGVDVRRVPLRLLRACIGYVPQTPFIFTGTVAENLDPLHRCSAEDMADALLQVGLWPTLLAATHSRAQAAAAAAGSGALPTERGAVLRLRLGEGGVGLSQGQQQMLCLARVILRRPRIVILDEASAAVDPGTAELMQQVVGASFGGGKATVIEVAHRLQSVAACDTIFVMEGGRVAEAGAPLELAAAPGSTFAAMLREQTGGSLDGHGCEIM